MESNRMKISEFAQATGITRRNLLFYDEIGLLSPAMVDKNNKYRYYAYHQIDTANVITVLREIGMPLKEIKAYLCDRSPEKLIAMLNTQKRIVQKKVIFLIQISDMLDTRIDLTEKGLTADADTNAITVQECEATPILLGPALPEYSHMLDGWYSLVDFYNFCEQHQVIRGLPTGTIIDHEDLIQGNFARPSRYYYRSVSGSSYPNNAEKPKGLYVIGWEHTEYGESHRLYDRLYRCIEESGLKICGHAYEEYLLDEISTTDSAQYLLQVAIHVRK